MFELTFTFDRARSPIDGVFIVERGFARADVCLEPDVRCSADIDHHGNESTKFYADPREVDCYTETFATRFGALRRIKELLAGNYLLVESYDAQSGTVYSTSERSDSYQDDVIDTTYGFHIRAL